MSFFRGLLPTNQSQQQGNSGNVEDTIEKLTERVQNSELLADRRDAVKALKSLAKKYRLEVGSHAMDVLVEEIRRDRGSSADITSMAVDCMSYVIGEDEDGPMGGEEGSNDELGERFAEIYIKKAENVSLILELIEDYDFSVRRPSLRFLTGLLRHVPHELQEKLLQDPAATSRLTDLLLETREFIRNDAILMMCELTRGNPHIQKLVAYENAFQILLDIVFQEGDSIVVEDCLYVILNLLKNNPSNQQLFKEHSLIQRLAQLLKFYMHPDSGPADLAIPNGHGDAHGEDSPGWTAQRVANVHLLFDVIRTLVSPSNSEKMVQAAQKTMNSCGLLEELCDTLLAEGIPADVLTEAIRAVAEVIRGYHPNQEFFGSIMAPSEPPKSAVLVLLLSMTNDKQPFGLRCAVLYCFQAYLHKNEKGKNQIIRTLLPSSAETSELTAGHVLCTGLLSSDPSLVWFCCVALMHCLLDTPSLKEQLLRVQLATSLGEAPVSLLHQICAVLCQHGTRKPQIASGILMLLGVWLQKCPVAVAHFLHKEENIAFLTSFVGSSGTDASEQQQTILEGLCAFVLGICLFYNDDSAEKCNRSALSQIYERRVGKEVIAERLEAVSRSELYVRAAQRTHPVGKNPAELILDHEFTKVFKGLEGELAKLLCPSEDGGGMSNGPGSLPHTVEQHEKIMESYKELIKRQDAQITDLSAQVSRLHTEVEQERQKNIAQHSTQQNHLNEQQQAETAELERLRNELTEKCQLVEQKDQELLARRNMTGPTEGVSASPVDSDLIESLKAENAQLKSQIENLNVMYQQKQSEAATYQNYSAQWQAYQVGVTPDPNQVLASMQGQFAEMEQQLGYGWQAFEAQSHQLATAIAEKTGLEEKLGRLETQNKANEIATKEEKRISEEKERRLTEEVGILKKELSHVENEWRNSRVKLEKEIAGTKKEQDDLLVLLADQDQKLQDYRRRLVHAGQPVTEDEEEDEDNEPEGYR